MSVKDMIGQPWPSFLLFEQDLQKVSQRLNKIVRFINHPYSLFEQLVQV